MEHCLVNRHISNNVRPKFKGNFAKKFASVKTKQKSFSFQSLAEQSFISYWLEYHAVLTARKQFRHETQLDAFCAKSRLKNQNFLESD